MSPLARCFLIAFLPLLAAATGAQAQGWMNCQATAGDPVRAVEPLQAGVMPLEIVLALSSHSISSPFALQDSAGRGIAGATVEFQLPDQPSDLRFVHPEPSSTKRAVIGLDAGCTGYFPQMIGSATAGTAIATMRIVGRGPAIEVPIRSIVTTSWVSLEIPSPAYPEFVAIGKPIGVGAAAQWSDGQHNGPIAGTPITFTASAGPPTITFPNGTSTITVVSNAGGGAGTSGVPSGPGTIHVEARYPDGGLADRRRFIVTGAPTLTLEPVEIEYGALAQAHGLLRFSPFDCSVQEEAVSQLSAPIRFRLGSKEVSAARAWHLAQCTGDVLSIPISAPLHGLNPGTYSLRAEIQEGPLPAAVSAPVQVKVNYSRTLQAASGRGDVKIGAGNSEFMGYVTRCDVQSAEALAPTSLGAAGPGPAGIALPYGAFRVQLGGCQQSSYLDPAPPPPAPVQQILLELDEAPDPATVAFAYGPTADQPTPHWYALGTNVAGRQVRFEIEDANLGDDGLARDDTIRTLFALGVPRHAAIDGTFQDLWWAGPQENGWGMSIMQHRDVLFGVLFIYDNEGAPRWIVMPGGQWNSARTTYTGSLYSPTGTPNHANLPAVFAAGPAIGTLRLSPTSRDTMTLEYTINGVSGTKQVRRQLFGPVETPPAVRRDDMWWGGPQQSGWGFALAQQYNSYFGVMYTYDHDGRTIWFVAPSMKQAEGTTFTTGPIYRTSGPRWIGAPYDASALVVRDVGTLSFILSDPRTGQLLPTIEGRISFAQDIYRQPF